MGGADMSDRMVAHYLPALKNKNCIQKFFHLLSVTTVNASVVCRTVEKN